MDRLPHGCRGYAMGGCHVYSGVIPSDEYPRTPTETFCRHQFLCNGEIMSTAHSYLL